MSQVLKTGVFLFLLCINLFAQSEYFQKRSPDYDPTIPAPESVLHSLPGTRHATCDELRTYYELLQKASPGVALFDIGQSYENRPLYLVVISSEQNLSRLDELRQKNLQLKTAGYNNNNAQSLIETNPVFVWLAAAVHGDETSSPDALCELAYQLAAGQKKEILQNSVIIIDPIQNPDGRQRTIEYYSHFTAKNPDSDPDALEHSMAWPYGRGNHYLFDMNRDWFLLSQKESVARVSEYQKWYPQVFVDLHEMGYDMGYYFSPPADPINENVPAITREWWNVFGKANSQAFDVNGWQYWSREIFDQYYPGYGENWPALAGAVGMTYEQAGSDGMVTKRKDNQLLTFRQSVWQHFTAALTTVKTAVQNRQALLQYYYDYYRISHEEARKSKIKSFIINPETYPAESRQLAGILQFQGVEVYQSNVPFSIKTESKGKTQTRKFPENSIIIPVEQPAYFSVKALLDPFQFPDEKFLNKERIRFEQKRPSEIYDITAWSPLLSYGLDFACSIEANAISKRDFEPVSLILISQLQKASFAYLIPYQGKNTLQALINLLNSDCYVSVARKQFKIGNVLYEPGTLIIPVVANGATIHSFLEETAKKFSNKIIAVSGGWTDDGISLGSVHVQHIKKPRVAVLSDMPTSTYSFGEIWYLFEQVYGLDFTAIKTMALKNVKLSKFDVIVIPDSRNDYNDYTGKDLLNKLKNWVKEGGTLIGLDNGSKFIAMDSTGIASVKVGLEKKKEKSVPSEEDKTDKDKKSESIIDAMGVFYNTSMDPMHYLSIGLKKTIPVFVAGNTFFRPENKGFNVAVFKGVDSLMISGHQWKEGIEQWAEKVYLYNENIGKGQVILFAGDPLFRGSLLSTEKLFMNAVLFAPNMSELKRD